MLNINYGLKISLVVKNTPVLLLNMDKLKLLPILILELKWMLLPKKWNLMMPLNV
jgi:hypothetical protein